MRVWLVVLGALLSAAFTVPDIEPVYGVSVGKQGVTIRLASNGCTKKSDLTVAVSKHPARPLMLIARKHPDTCKSFAAGRAEVVYSFEELGLEPGQAFSLANPLIGDPGPAP